MPSESQGHHPAWLYASYELLTAGGGTRIRGGQALESQAHKGRTAFFGSVEEPSEIGKHLGEI